MRFRFEFHPSDVGFLLVGERTVEATYQLKYTFSSNHALTDERFFNDLFDEILEAIKFVLDLKLLMFLDLALYLLSSSYVQVVHCLILGGKVIGHRVPSAASLQAEIFGVVITTNPSHDSYIIL